MKTLADAFYDELRDVFGAEKQRLEVLPHMANAACSPALRQAFEAHVHETDQHIRRVERAFGETGKAVRAKTCEVMKALIEEASRLMQENAADDVRDALLIAAAQKAGHYEIAAYGTLCTWADLLGYGRALALLQENIDDEEAADRELSLIAKSINTHALSHSSGFCNAF